MTDIASLWIILNAIILFYFKFSAHDEFGDTVKYVMCEKFQIKDLELFNATIQGYMRTRPELQTDNAEPECNSHEAIAGRKCTLSMLGKYSTKHLWIVAKARLLTCCSS